MAIIHRADLTPTKIELLSTWVPQQPWLGGADASSLELVAAYRFDDPAGEVGIETHLLRTADGQVLQVATTYRSAPVAGAEPALIGTMLHSVLGQRWVYDGTADPVYAAALAEAILTGGTEAALELQTDNGSVTRESVIHVHGSGTPGTTVPAIGSVNPDTNAATTVIRTGSLTLVLLRVLGPGMAEDNPRRHRHLDRHVARSGSARVAGDRRLTRAQAVRSRPAGCPASG